MSREADDLEALLTAALGPNPVAMRHIPEPTDTRAMRARREPRPVVLNPDTAEPAVVARPKRPESTRVTLDAHRAARRALQQQLAEEAQHGR